MSLRNLIESNQEHLKHMEETNKRYILLKDKQTEFSQKVSHARRHLNSTKILETIIENYRVSYSREILTLMTNALAKCLQFILLDKSYDIELEIYTFYEKQHLRVWLIDDAGVKLPPSIVEGDMLNQVMSFCASVILTRLRGYTWFYYDEAFASANFRSVIMIRQLIRTFLEEGFNFVFVSQNPLLFTEFERNLIELVQESGCVSEVVQTFIPALSDDTLDERALELHDNLLRGVAYDK